MPEERNEQEIARGYKQGDRAVFERLYRDHCGGIAAYFQRHFFISRVDSIDLAQEVFARFFSGRCRDAFREDMRLFPYLVGIANNVGKDHLEERKRQTAFRTISPLHERGVEMTFEQNFDAGMIKRLMLEFLGSLDQEEKELVIFYYHHRFTLVESAERFNLSVMQVRTRLKKIKSKLILFLTKNKAISNIEGEGGFDIFSLFIAALFSIGYYEM
ncbi:MAG: sigma-70 family RNA polymerase sigma factor [Deltaproteobacteria bacterium]|nr:sigma-70 family RNA polymerase sigma factor [Deltaproteobacteria bacterium]